MPIRRYEVHFQTDGKGLPEMEEQTQDERDLEYYLECAPRVVSRYISDLRQQANEERVSGWQKIETAPKETQIMLWIGGVWQHPTFGSYKHSDEHGRVLWVCQCGFYEPNVPTFWQPLPDPPTEG